MTIKTMGKNFATVANNTMELISNFRTTDPEKVTVIHGNLVLKNDTTYNNSIRVEGDIIGKNGREYDLRVNGNITAWGDINAMHIDAWDIIVRNITAYGNIHAKGKIHTGFILCEKLTRVAGTKLVCKNLIEKRSTYMFEEVKR